MEEKQTYSVDVKCGNCEFSGRVNIPKNTPVSEHPCPECGLKNLSKYMLNVAL